MVMKANNKFNLFKDVNFVMGTFVQNVLGARLKEEKAALVPEHIEALKS
jgi:hypothetical protein